MKKGISKRTVAISLAVIAVVAVVIAAGTLTGWFGIGKGNGTYVMTKATHYNSNGDKSQLVKYKRDEHGNPTSYTVDYYSNNKVYKTQEYNVNVDKYGHSKKLTYTSEVTGGSGTADFTRENKNEIDANGKLTSVDYKSELISSEGSTEGVQTNEGTGEYAYHSNGRLKSQSFEYTHAWAEKRGGKESTESKHTSSSEYDDRGYLLHEETTSKTTKGTSSSYDTETEYDWQFDLSGKPTSCTITYTRDGDDYELWYSFDTDEAGNITAIYDAYGNKVAEFEYERIDDPSESIRNILAKPSYFTLGEYAFQR